MRHIKIVDGEIRRGPPDPEKWILIAFFIGVILLFIGAMIVDRIRNGYN